MKLRFLTKLIIILLFLAGQCNYISCAQEISQISAAPENLIEGSQTNNDPADPTENNELPQAPNEFQEDEPKLEARAGTEHLTGDWRGFRSKLEEHGVMVELIYTNDTFLKLHGGLNKKVLPKSMGLLDLGVEFDTKKMHLWPGGKFFFLFENKHGHGLSETQVGDIQLLSNIDARGLTQLSEYWYEQSLLSDKIKIKIGKQDANNDFSALACGFEFLNSSITLIPTVEMPTYPDQALGVVTFVEPYKGIVIKGGIFDGEGNGKSLGFKTAFDGEGGALNIAEVNFNPTIRNCPGNYLIGFWYHTGDVDEITDNPDPRRFSSHYGVYAAFQQMIYKENKEEEDTQGLCIFGQFGWAPSDRSEISRYYGAGLLYKGMIPGRKDDTTGIAAAIADLSDRLKSISGRTAETALEVFYKFQITPYLAIQPDLQFIFRPNGIEKNALVIGIRTVINF